MNGYTKQNVMKNMFTFKKIWLIAMLMMLTGTVSYGATFTAVASGNWSSTTTWGGSVPPLTITSDQVIISSGINVTMDNNATLNGALALMDVEGTLSSSSNATLTVVAGAVSGSGVINIGNLVCGTSAIVSFTGSLAADTVTCSALNLLVAADIMVNQTLTLSSGILSLQTGGSLDVGADATIVISGGVLTLNGGTLGLSGTYNVVYTSGSAIAGVELSGSGLSDVTIDVSTGSTVTLTADLAVSGTLSLTSGTLVLAGNNLTITGDVSASGSGLISSTSASNISISTAASVSGSLSFTSAGDVVNNLTVNVGGNGSVMLGSNITIQGTLNLVSGCLNAGSYNVEIGLSGSITGASNTSYVITGLNGTLSMHLTAGASAAVTFPVGTSVQFCPAAIMLNTGSASGEVFVGAGANVYASGTSGVDISLTQPVVDATWYVHSEITANLNMNLELMWAAAAEVNAFNHMAAYISHYTSGSWDVSATASATLEANGMFSLNRNNITSLSPFAVFDQNTNPTSVKEVPGEVSFDLYPNPAVDFITVNYNSKDAAYIEVINIIGTRLEYRRVMKSNTIIPLDKLPPGNYFVRVYNDNISLVKRFIKL
ncbi:MAG TPA: T9SS type A sorting domain-containing protein [Bacteroidia bacterium]|nr:T9SS type A sorting domain-containing protein [Bacteroidia bacterium]